MGRQHLEMLRGPGSGSTAFMNQADANLSPSDGRKRPIWRNTGSSQVTAATDQVFIVESRGGEGFPRTHGGTDCIVIAVATGFPSI
jgi:hypothetical protein